MVTYSFDRSHVQHVASPSTRRHDSSARTSGAFSDRLTFSASNGTGWPLRNTTVPWSVSVARSGANAAPVNPAAETIRPQLGSLPWIAHFTRGEFAIARAIVRASDSEAAPRMVTTTTFVAPSPSAAIW